MDPIQEIEKIKSCLVASLEQEDLISSQINNIDEFIKPHIELAIKQKRFENELMEDLEAQIKKASKKKRKRLLELKQQIIKQGLLNCQSRSKKYTSYSPCIQSYSCNSRK